MHRSFFSENQPPCVKPLILFMVVASLSNAHAIPAHQQSGKRSDGKNAAAENLREALPLVREGDIVFIRVKSFLYRKVA